MSNFHIKEESLFESMILMENGECNTNIYTHLQIKIGMVKIVQTLIACVCVHLYIL